MGLVQGCLVLMIGLAIIGGIALAVGTLLLIACQVIGLNVISPFGLFVIIIIAFAVSIRPSLWVMDRVPID